jgi:hypothetical protein
VAGCDQFFGEGPDFPSLRPAVVQGDLGICMDDLACGVALSVLDVSSFCCDAMKSLMSLDKA